MILTNYNGQNVYVLDLAPSWDQPFTVDAVVVSQTDASLSNREGRRPHAGTLRLRTRFSITATGSDARRVAGALRNLGIEPVVAPLWPAAVRWADRGTRPIGGGINIVYKEDWSQFAIYEGVEPGWPLGDDAVAPLLWGRIEGKEPNWFGPEQMTFAVDHNESSKAAWAIVPAAVGWTAGPSPSGGWAAAPKLFPFEINFKTVKELFSVRILREAIGFGRATAETLYPQTVAREPQTDHFFTTAADAAAMLRFFLEFGTGAAFWAADWVSAATLTADVAAGQTVLQVLDTSAVKAGDWLAFVRPGGWSQVLTARVQATTVNTITVDVSPGPLTAGATLVSQLMLARFSKPAMTLQFRSADLAEAVLPLTELPAEYVPAADEVLGTTLGLLPTRCFLYEFSRVLAGATYTDRFTSYESDLSLGGNNYASSKITHGDLLGGLYLDRDELEIKTDLFAGNPLLAVATMTMAAPLKALVRAAEVNGANAVNASVLFNGAVTAVSVQGSRLTARASPGGTMFERTIPRMQLQLGDNFSLFSAGNALLKGDWKFTAAVQGAGAPGYPFAIVLQTLARVSGPAPTYFANWFAGGWIEFGAGLTWQQRSILVSTNPVAGVLTVTLDRDPNPYPLNGDAVVLYPGYDLRIETAKPYSAGNPQGKFDNYVNFGGHPLLPISNPSLVLVQQRPPSSGGKK